MTAKKITLNELKELVKQVVLKETELSKENDSHNSLDKWKDLMEKNDLKIFKEFQQKSKLDIEQIREMWKVMRRNALHKLNVELEKSGKKGKLMSIDVSDEELYDYLNKDNAELFFKYSRILDFADGYMPKNMILVKKKIV